MERLDRGSLKNGFLNHGEALEVLRNITEQCSDIIQEKVIGKSYENRDIVAYVLNSKSTASTVPSVQAPRLLVTSLMHSTEPAGLVVVLYFLGKMCEDYQRGNHERDHLFVKYLVHSREVWVVPFVNVDGFVAVGELNSLWLRKNRRPTCPSSENPEDGGVDLNRNFGFHYEHVEDKCSEEYAGWVKF